MDSNKLPPTSSAKKNLLSLSISAIEINVNRKRRKPLLSNTISRIIYRKLNITRLSGCQGALKTFLTPQYRGKG